MINAQNVKQALPYTRVPVFYVLLNSLVVDRALTEQQQQKQNVPLAMLMVSIILVPQL